MGILVNRHIEEHPTLISITQASKILGQPRQQVHKDAVKGRLGKVYRIGDSVIVLERAAIDEMAEFYEYRRQRKENRADRAIKSDSSRAVEAPRLSDGQVAEYEPLEKTIADMLREDND